MISEYYKVSTIRLSEELPKNKIAVGSLVYVYCVNNETYNEAWMEFVDNARTASVKKQYPRAYMTSKAFYSLDELKGKWGRFLELPSIELLLTPEVSEDNMTDAGVRRMNGEKIPPMPAIPVTLYMELNGGVEGNFYPFNGLD